MGLFSKVVPAGGDELNGKFIPAGTSICTNLSSLLRSPALFGNKPEVFRPERFMELDKLKRSEMERNTEPGFGYGQFMCMGKKIPLNSLNKITFEVSACLSHCFDLANST
jgi:cytochrome P450